MTAPAINLMELKLAGSMLVSSNAIRVNKELAAKASIVKAVTASRNQGDEKRDTAVLMVIFISPTLRLSFVFHPTINNNKALSYAVRFSALIFRHLCRRSHNKSVRYFRRALAIASLSNALNRFDIAASG